VIVRSNTCTNLKGLVVKIGHLIYGKRFRSQIIDPFQIVDSFFRYIMYLDLAYI
jgi:hypothetical protein